MRTLSIPKYTPSKARCNTLFFRVLRSLSPENHMRDATALLLLSLVNNSFASLYSRAFSGLFVLRQVLLQLHRGASAASGAAGSPEASAFPPQPSYITASSATSPLFTAAAFLVSFALLKERYKNNETTKENPPPPYLTFSLAPWSRRWVLASLSSPSCARVDLRPHCHDTLTTATRTKKGGVY